MANDLTPMMRQYLSIKENSKDSILFFRLGDFYEMFFDDAIEATRILHITLTSREAGKGNKVPMCGIPFHAADSYITRLVKHGKKVAICEQVEEPSGGGKIVKREITKIITPGTFVADELLGSATNNYILSLNKIDQTYGLAYADISTGEFRLTEIKEREELFSELYKISPSECLVSETFSKEDDFKRINDVNLGAVTLNEDWMFDYDLSLREIKDHFSVRDLSGFGCEEMKNAVGAAGALLKYLKHTQKSGLNNLDTISTYRLSQYMTMDWNTHRNLELIQNIEDLSTKATLFEVLDQTKTPMGRRKMKKWVLNPLLDKNAIGERLDSVQFFYEESRKRKGAREILSRIYDIERLSNKVSLATANARDMVALSSSLSHITELKEMIRGSSSSKIQGIAEGLDDFNDIVSWVGECLVENPPNNLKEGGLVKKGYSKDLDELKEIVTNSKDWLAGLQKKEIERTGISSLKIGYNRVFGYYIEVTKANLDSVPENYVRKQTLANAERFITQELKSEESKIIGAQERMKDLEYGIFCELREKTGDEIERLKKTSELISGLDCISNLAEVAVNNKYSRPKVTDEKVLRIKEGRHPVVERLLKGKEFVANDILMDDEENIIFIITGSNMAGKSTFIRQVALITVMAQMGGFVPAKEAEIGIVDRVFTRVGASDRLYRGMSTFMVEMLETANILNNATGRSLIILDEIGRGTSTFDGVSIAWAVVEYIHHRLKGAKTLFATHFHELTELADVLKGAGNFNLAVREWKDEVIFLYKVAEGSCDESLGVHVAKLAGMPKDVISRAHEILNNLQKDSLLGNIRERFSEKDEEGEKQLDFFEGYKAHPVIDKLKEMDIENMTPMEALKKLSELKDDA